METNRGRTSPPRHRRRGCACVETPVEDVRFQGFHFPISVSGKKLGERDARLDQFLKGYREGNLHLTAGGFKYLGEFLDAYRAGPDGEDPYIVLHMTTGHRESHGKGGCVGLVKIDWERMEDVPLNPLGGSRTGGNFFHEKFLRQRMNPDWASNQRGPWWSEEFVIPVKPVEGTRIHVENPISFREWNKMYNGQSWKRSLKRNKNVRAPLSEWVEMLK